MSQSQQPGARIFGAQRRRHHSQPPSKPRSIAPGRPALRHRARAPSSSARAPKVRFPADGVGLAVERTASQRARLRVRHAVHHAAYARMHERHRAHHARLSRAVCVVAGAQIRSTVKRRELFAEVFLLFLPSAFRAHRGGRVRTLLFRDHEP